MTALVLNEEQMMVRDQAARFLDEQGGVDALRTLRDTDDPLGYSADSWAAMIELGWPAMLVPESAGGFGFGHVGMAQIMEQLGRTLTPSPLFATAVAGACAIDLAGTDAQRQALLPAVAGGELTLAAATDGAARSASQGVYYEATAYGVVLNGPVNGVIDGHCADKLVVRATALHGGDDAWVVLDREHTGVTVTRVQRVDSGNSASLTLTNVALPTSAVLGEAKLAPGCAERLLDIASVHLSAELLGIAQEAFERTVQYLKERKQFGMPIGSFQALQHRAAHQWTELELVKSAVLDAALALDNDDDSGASQACSAAKSLACRVAEHATSEAIQMHGGVGMTDEYDVGLFLKRARCVQALYGDHRYHADRFARLDGY
ncbi:MAG: acyl-CoA dehydrogenase family protein [Pseudomonadota bacterium]